MAIKLPSIRRSAALQGSVAGAVLAGALLWAYWPTLVGMEERWAHDPQYSHGYLVPVFALVVLWFRRDKLNPTLLRFSWWGLPWLLAGSALHLAGGFLFYEWLDSISLLPSITGVCLLLGGRNALGWAWPTIAFLIFMLPLPYQLEVALAHPLQRWATLASTYLLQTFGLPALSEGNIIIIDKVQLGVLEACNGLGMLLTFIALSTAVALVIQRRFEDKILILASAIPIALVANVARITITGVLLWTTSSAVAHAFYHDLAGWFMMPLALVLLWIELQFLSRLFIVPEPEGPIPIRFSATQGNSAAVPESGRKRRGIPREIPTIPPRLSETQEIPPGLTQPDPAVAPANNSFAF